MLLPLFFLSFSDFLDWKYLDITFISFLDLAGRGGGGGALLIMTGVGLGASFLELPLVGGMRSVNFDEILFLSVLVLWSVNNESHLDLYTDEMKLHIASPIPSKSARSFALLLSTCLPWIYLAKKLSVTLIFLASDAKCSMEP